MVCFCGQELAEERARPEGASFSIFNNYCSNHLLVKMRILVHWWNEGM